MEKQYMIKTTGVQIERGQRNKVEVVTLGSYTYEKERQTISYVECDGEMAGCKTEITVYGDNIVETVRNGSFALQLTAERKKRHQCCYDTPYGRVMLGVFCNGIKNTLKENGGELKFSYTMDVNSELLSENEVEISIKEAVN